MQSTLETLYIYAGGSELIFAQYDHLQHSAVSFTTYAVKPTMSLNANMHEALATIPLASGRDRRVCVLFEGPSMLVPIGDFNEESADEMFSFNFTIDHTRSCVYYDVLPRMDAVLLFAVDKDTCHTLKETYPNITIQSVETPLLLHYFSQQTLDTEGRLYATVRGEKMTVVTFRDGQLGLYNTFTLHHVEDGAFYLLRMLQLARMRPEEDRIVLCAKDDFAHQLQELIQPYFPNIERADGVGGLMGGMKGVQDKLPYDMVVYMLRAY